MPIGTGASAIALQQVAHLVVGRRRRRVLLTCRISACEPSVGGGRDGVVDGVDDDRVEQPADLQHVDRATSTPSVAGSVDPVSAPACLPPTPAEREHAPRPASGGEQGDR